MSRHAEAKSASAKLFRKARRAIKKSTWQKFVYAWCWKHCSISKKTILFESFHGKTISDSPLRVLLELKKTGEISHYKVYFATNGSNNHTQLIQDMGLKIKLVGISSLQYAKVLATAEYLLNNSSFPSYFIRRNHQVYMQTWHGTPLKTLGKQMRLGIESMYNVQHNFLQASYITFPNNFTREVIMRDYNLEKLYTGKVIMIGYPRNDVFPRGTDAHLLHQQQSIERRQIGRASCRERV